MFKIAYRFKTIIFISILLSLLVVIQVNASELPAKIISAAWLAENLEKENLRIIDIRDNVKLYWTNHIPGAVYIHPESLRWPDRGVPVKLIPPSELIALLGAAGITEKSSIVVYGSRNDFNATYLLWSLDYIGHRSSSILDGGYMKWVEEKFPVMQEFPKINPTTYPEPPHLHDEVYATLEEVKEAVENKRALIVDVRPLNLYTGDEGFWIRNGHIKTAVHHYWEEDLAQDGSWKDKETLKEHYAQSGIVPDKTIIVSCGQGQMSSHTYFTLHHVLGFPNVSNYDGSFSEWSNVADLPVETGAPALPEVTPSPSPQLDARMLIQQRCTSCHNRTRIDKARKDRAGWEKTVDRMIKKGATLNTRERDAVIDHLASR